MSKRTKSQHIGERAENSVKQIIGANHYWVCRGQTHDYGIDLEAELCSPLEKSVQLTGRLIKLQVKGVESLRLRPSVYLSSNEILYASQFKVPFILILFDLKKSKGYWVWMQKYLLYKDVKVGRQDKKKLRIDFDADADLVAGLDGPLQKIALGENRDSIELALSDLLLALRKSNCFKEYEELLEFSERHAFGTFDIVLDQTIRMLISRVEAGDPIFDWREWCAVFQSLL